MRSAARVPARRSSAGRQTGSQGKTPEQPKEEVLCTFNSDLKTESWGVKVTFYKLNGQKKFRVSSSISDVAAEGKAGDMISVSGHSFRIDSALTDTIYEKGRCPTPYLQCSNGGTDTIIITGNKPTESEDCAHGLYDDITTTTKKTKPGTEYQNDDAIVGENFCSEPEAIKGLKAVGYLLFIAKILVPLIIIGMGTYDVYQSIVDPDKIMSKSVKGLLIRIAIGVAVFFIPRIVYTVLNIAQDMGVASEKSANCRKALLDPWNLGTDIGEQRTYSTDGDLTDRGYPDSKSGQ